MVLWRRKTVVVSPVSLSPVEAVAAQEISADAGPLECIRQCRIRPDIHQALTQLDDRLVALLYSSAIRLVRSEWLLQQPADFRMPYRQQLEALEREGASPSPLLTAEEAVALVRRGERAAAVLSHGWLSPGDPDPAGARLAVVRAALREQPHLEAIFWDFSSLFQHPPGGRRTKEEQAIFGQAIGVMGDLYASAIGTTVLQLKDIPPRPPEFDGTICLFNLSEGTCDAEIRAALASFGTIESCVIGEPTVVQFSSHEEAVAATKSDAALLGFCAGAATLYNERSYDGRQGDSEREGDDGRGWCCFESAVSSEVTSRLEAIPKIRAELSRLPPKLLLLGTDAPVANRGAGGEELGARLQQVVAVIERATFTGAGDKPMVVDLYQKYVDRITSALQSTLAFAGSDSTMALELPAVPKVEVPKPQPLVLSAGQVLLVPTNYEARRDGYEGDPQFGSVKAGVDSTGIELSLGGESALTFDGISQVALPWRPPAKGWDAPFLRDVKALPAVSKRLWAVSQQLGDAKRIEAVKSVVEAELRDILNGLVISTSIANLIEANVAAVITALSPPKIPPEKDSTGRPAKTETQEESEEEKGRRESGLQQRLKDTAANLARWGAAALRETGAAGARRYADGQRLTVRHMNEWVDAVVGRNGSVLVAGEEVLLHPWNHAPRTLPGADFEALRKWWLETLRVKHSYIADALTGRRLDVLQQCVAISFGAQSEGKVSSNVTDARSLSVWLHSMHAKRCEGGATKSPTAVLLTGPPAAGKTSLLSQLIVHSLDSELVPVLLKAQHMQRGVRDQPDAFTSAWNWVDAHLRLEHDPAVYGMLRQALASRRALVIIDGLDEGGALRGSIERHVTGVLAQQGHVILATSRPAGLDSTLFVDFHQLDLAPLSIAQQREALQQRLGDKADNLLEYVESSVPRDPETGQRVTANPLMLSMVASVFELRAGRGMPSSVVELYRVASDAMLARGRLVSDELRQLLQMVFFKAQDAEQRVITDEHLVKAAKATACSQTTLGELETGVLSDTMPLLSLLQAEPLQLQSSHLSFQEYFAARQLCQECTRLEGALPWRWSASWANVVGMGADLGEPFFRGVLHAAGAEGDSLDLQGRLGGHRPTSLRIVTLLATCLVNLNLSSNMLGDSGAIVCADALKDNAVLTELDLGGNEIGDEGATALASALELNGVLKGLDLDNNHIGDTGAVAIAEALRGNEVLKRLNLNHNRISDEGAIALGEALKVNKVILLDLRYNDIDQACVLDALGTTSRVVPNIVRARDGYLHRQSSETCTTTSDILRRITWRIFMPSTTADEEEGDGPHQPAFHWGRPEQEPEQSPASTAHAELPPTQAWQPALLLDPSTSLGAGPSDAPAAPSLASKLQALEACLFGVGYVPPSLAPLQRCAAARAPN